MTDETSEEPVQAKPAVAEAKPTPMAVAAIEPVAAREPTPAPRPERARKPVPPRTTQSYNATDDELIVPPSPPTPPQFENESP